MSQEILKPETEENKFDEEDEIKESELNKVVEEEQKGAQKEFTIDTRTGEVLTEEEKRERIEKGFEK